MQTTSFEQKPPSGTDFQIPTDFSDLNDTLKSLTPIDRLKYIFSQFHGKVLVLSSAGIGSAVVPELIRESANESDLKIAKDIRKIPIVLIDTGALFDETVHFAASLRSRLGLNFIRASHNLDSSRFLELASQLITAKRSPEEAFDEITKVHTLGNLLKSPEVLGLKEVEVIISGNRRADSPSRSGLQFAEYKNDRFFVYPIADLSDRDVDDFYQQRLIKDHPLKERGYLSVGNIHDSRPAEKGDSYVKAGRHGQERQECGIHLRWALQDIPVRLIHNWNLRVISPSPDDIRLSC